MLTRPFWALFSFSLFKEVTDLGGGKGPVREEAAVMNHFSGREHKGAPSRSPENTQPNKGFCLSLLSKTFLAPHSFPRRDPSPNKCIKFEQIETRNFQGRSALRFQSHL